VTVELSAGKAKRVNTVQDSKSKTPTKIQGREKAGRRCQQDERSVTGVAGLRLKPYSCRQLSMHNALK
jgi:hypothetical protein